MRQSDAHMNASTFFVYSVLVQTVKVEGENGQNKEKEIKPMLS